MASPITPREGPFAAARACDHHAGLPLYFSRTPNTLVQWLPSPLFLGGSWKVFVLTTNHRDASTLNKTSSSSVTPDPGSPWDLAGSILLALSAQGLALSKALHLLLAASHHPQPSSSNELSPQRRPHRREHMTTAATGPRRDPSAPSSTTFGKSFSAIRCLHPRILRPHYQQNAQLISHMRRAAVANPASGRPYCPGISTMERRQPSRKRLSGRDRWPPTRRTGHEHVAIRHAMDLPL
jgi:hypothetical protein